MGGGEGKSKFVFDSSNVIEGTVFMFHLRDIKVIRCVEISCPCEMGILMNQEVESHLNI